MERKTITVLFTGLALIMTSGAFAGYREQAKRIHDRLAGVPPTAATLNTMQDQVDPGAAGTAIDAAYEAMNHPDFYRVTLKNFITPWTNEEQTVFAPLNDYTATVIGTIFEEYDFRSILTSDVLYVGTGITPGYSSDSNAHYQAMTDANSDLMTVLTRTTQSGTYNMASGPFPASAAAGVMTSRQGAKAFYVDGTNRAMFRFTVLNHLCTDLEQIKDTSRSPDRVRQDVSRSPGGDSRIYMNACVGCHAGMDPLAQAYAYYDYSYPLDGNNDPLYDQGQMVFNNAGFIDPDTGTRVQGKYHINANNFEFGYQTPDDQWDNYWRVGPISNLGWGWAPGSSSTGTGSGAASMGQELADSYAFAQCQVEKVFKAVCMRSPVDQNDRDQIDSMITSFITTNGANTNTGYNLKQVFAESAVYCMGD